MDFRLPAIAVLCLGSAPTLVAAQAWEPVPCVPIDLPPEAMFDVAEVVDDFETDALEWVTLRGGQNALNSISRDTEESRSGEGSLRVDYQFDGRPGFYEYIQLTTDLPIPEAGSAIGFWLKTDGTPFPVRVRITDASGETHQVDMVVESGTGWYFAAIEIDTVTNSWGGDANRRLDYPCTLGGLCIDRVSQGYVAQGSLWIDDVALLKKRELPNTLLVETPSKRFGNVYDVGESVALRMTAEGEEIRWSVTDFSGIEIASGSGPADGTEAALALTDPGFLASRIEVLEDGEVLEGQVFACAALAPGEPLASDFVGIGCHFGQNHYPLGLMELMCRYAVHRFRDELLWRSVEVTKGEHALPDHGAAYIEHAGEVGLKPLIIFDYNNPHYDDDGFPNSPAAIQGFAEYAVNLARLTRGVVTDFEVWNEWIGACGMTGRPGDNSPEAYGKLLGPTYAAVKNDSPDVTIAGIGGEYGPATPEHVARMIGSAGANSMDAFSIHPYRFPRAPEASDLVGEVERIIQSATDHGAPRRAWITEIGYPTHRGPGGIDGRTQAQYCVRTMALLQAVEGVERVYWYDLKDDALLRNYDQHNFGLIHHHAYNAAPKPGIVALGVFSRMTAGATVRGLTQDDSVHVVSYATSDDKELLIAWCAEGEEVVGIEGHVTAACDIAARPLQVGGTVTLSGSPVYLIGAGLRIEVGE